MRLQMLPAFVRGSLTRRDHPYGVAAPYVHDRQNPRQGVHPNRDQPFFRVGMVPQCDRTFILQHRNSIGELDSVFARMAAAFRGSNHTRSLCTALYHHGFDTSDPSSRICFLGPDSSSAIRPSAWVDPCP